MNKDLKVLYGSLVSGNFHRNTMTFEIDDNMEIRAGYYAIVRLDSVADSVEFEALLKNEKDNESQK